MNLDVQIKKFWGMPEQGCDYLVEESHGDGGKVVYLQTMDSRPFGYYLRVDSSLDLSLSDECILPEDSDCNFGEMLLRMIEDEFDNIDRYYEVPNMDGLVYTNDQDKAEGHEPFFYKMPMLSLGAGYSYFEIVNDKLK